MISLDTSILLRWLTQDIPKQAKQADELIQSGETLGIADMTIQELTYVLEKGYLFSRADVADNISLIMSLGQVNCNRPLFRRVLPLYIAHPALSFVDCCLVVYAELNDATPLYTFDKKLAKQAPHATLLH